MTAANRWLDGLSRDARYAMRSLTTSPLVALTVITTLALCIGVNTAIFTVVDRLIVRKPPYPDPERLAAVSRVIQSTRLSNNFGQNGRAWEALSAARSIDLAATGGLGGATSVALAA